MGLHNFRASHTSGLFDHTRNAGEIVRYVTAYFLLSSRQCAPIRTLSDAHNVHSRRG